MSQLAEKTASTKSLVYRVLAELEARDFVARDAAGMYSLGVVTVELGGAFSTSLPMMTSIRRLLRKLADTNGETASLGILRGDQVLYLVREEGERSVLAVSHTGKLLPANATALGKALLAELADDQVRAIFLSGDGSGHRQLQALTPHTITSLSRLLQELDGVRSRGYADEHQETVLGRGCVSVAVPLGMPGMETVGISISMSEPRLAAAEADAVEQLDDVRKRIIREVRSRAAIGEAPSPIDLAIGTY
jgi:DNA-binding IclR family transcriptional regulator